MPALQGKRSEFFPITSYCNAFSHLPQYLGRLMANRGDGQDGVNDINDTRNGLLLVSMLHKAFGFGEVAFLKVTINQGC
jgi:hypothetical protein